MQSLAPTSWTRHEVKRGVVNCLPCWQAIIDDLDLNLSERAPVKVLPELVFVTHRGERIEPVEKLRKAISMLDRSRPCSAHIYISLRSNTESFGWHEDLSDVFYVQAIGRVRCQVFEGGFNDYVLEPGDMIFLPKGVQHCNTALSPRVGLSIGLD